MARPLILIVDDEADLRTLMQLAMTRMGLDTQLAQNLREARALLQRHRFDVCLTDLNLPDGSGLQLVQEIVEQQPGLPVAVITAYGSMDVAIEALKTGAFDFVSKPIELPRLRDLVQRALQLKHAAVPPVTPDHPLNQQLIGTSPAMQQLRTLLAKVARSQAPVYISGESGTGKEVAARLIHQLGPRSTGPFVPVNCGAIPSELMESEFFGHKKGSFTGATEDKQGLFQSAHGGTLFLDEVADLPLSMQVKLLRAIQEKKIRPVGGQQEIAVDLRVLSATHKNLSRMVEAGQFRQDLYYRINVIEIKIPPLREREGDVLILADSFLKKLAQEWQLTAPQLSPRSRQHLLDYPFPGNVRELHNTLERALTLCEGDTILPEHLQLSPVVVAAEAHPSNTLPPEGLEAHLQAIEKQLLLRALELSHWNRTAAAKKLGMTFRSLRYRLKKLGLDDSSDGAEDHGEDDSEPLAPI